MYEDLKFVNSNFTKLHERVSESIYYFKTVQEAMESKLRKKRQLKSCQLKVNDIIKIYEQCCLMTKPSK